MIFMTDPTVWSRSHLITKLRMPDGCVVAAAARAGFSLRGSRSSSSGGGGPGAAVVVLVDPRTVGNPGYRASIYLCHAKLMGTMMMP